MTHLSALLCFCVGLSLPIINSKYLYLHDFFFLRLHHACNACNWASLVAQMVKHLPTMRKTGVRSLGQEDPLEKEMATHSSILALNIPLTEEPGRLQSMGLKRLGHD